MQNDRRTRPGSTDERKLRARQTIEPSRAKTFAPLGLTLPRSFSPKKEIKTKTRLGNRRSPSSQRTFPANFHVWSLSLQGVESGFGFGFEAFDGGRRETPTAADADDR